MMKRSSIFLSSIAAICVLIGNAYAAVIEQNEWNNKTQTGWDYSSLTGNPTIDASPAGGSSPSGGSAIRANFSAGTYPSSIGGGTSNYTFPGDQNYTELYVGHWIKWSNPFDWNPVGTKFDYLTARDLTSGTVGTGRDNFLVMIQNNGATLTFTQQLWSCPPCTQNRFNNRAGVNIQKGRWYWFEIHARYNTVGSANGLFEAWIDDVLVMEHNDVTFRTYNTVMGSFQHAPVWGGGGGTINQTQHMWWDHTVLSTTRIGRPTSASPLDTTAPRSPTLNFAN